MYGKIRRDFNKAGQPSALESGSRARHFFDVLYICRKSTLAESTSLSGSRATLVAKLLAFNAVSTQIFPMMPHKVIDHLALAIAQDLVISAITRNPMVSTLSSLLLTGSMNLLACPVQISSQYRYRGLPYVTKVSLAASQP